jgi:hypothetical protein
MMSPACGCQQSVRLERLLSEAAADSWPHSGLAEILSIADVTPRSCDLTWCVSVIRRAAELRQRRQAAFDAADAELRRLIREGFKDGIPGEQLAQAAGLSVSRVYQIRDGRR